MVAEFFADEKLNVCETTQLYKKGISKLVNVF